MSYNDAIIPNDDLLISQLLTTPSIGMFTPSQVVFMCLRDSLYSGGIIIIALHMTFGCRKTCSLPSSSYTVDDLSGYC